MCVALLLAVAIFMEGQPVRAAGEVGMVVVASDANLGNVSRSDLKRILTGKSSRWPGGGKPVIIVTAGESELHRWFVTTWAGKSPSQFRNTWRRAVFTGKGRLPTRVASLDEMAGVVASTLGAVGYLPVGELPDGLKVLEL